MNQAIALQPLNGRKLRHINLYTDAFAPKTVLFSARFMLLYAALLLFAIFGYAAVLRQHEQQLETTLRVAQQGLARDEATLEILRQQAGPSRLAALQAEAGRLEKQVQDRHEVLRYLDSRLQGEQIRPASILDSLANASRPGIWLTDIHVSEGGRTVRLAGGTLNADRLPAYLNALNTYHGFPEAKFRSFSVSTPKPEKLGASYLHFELASGKPDGAGAASAEQAR